MKVLIVENDTNKSSEVEYFLLSEMELSPELITIKKSYQSGLESILTEHYDVLILDMSLPTFDITDFDDGGETLDRGGEIILQEMERENIKTAAIILTQYEDFGGMSLAKIDQSLQHDFPEFYKGCVYYNNITQDSWKNNLKQKLDDLIL